jgi:hypothetical protein
LFYYQQIVANALLMQFCGRKFRKMKDFFFDEDLDFGYGDFKIGESSRQHIKHILIANKGQFKANPEIGASIEQMINAEDAMDFLIEAKKNLQYDGLAVNNISFTQDGKLNVDAKYTE